MEPPPVAVATRLSRGERILEGSQDQKGGAGGAAGEAPRPTDGGEDGAAEEHGSKEGPPVRALQPDGLEAAPHFGSTSFSTTSWAEEPLPGSISRVSASRGAGLVWLWGGGWLTRQVLDRVHHLGQEAAVLLLPAGGGTSLDVLE